MRSGSTRWRAPPSRATPSTTMRGVPAPEIRAAILFRQSARSTISGSHAAFSIRVEPRASDDAVVAENALQLAHVRKSRHVVQYQRLLGEQARDHQRQRGVLRPRNGNYALKRPAPDDPDAIHVPPPALSKIRRLHRRLYCGKTREPSPIRRDRSAIFFLPPR